MNARRGLDAPIGARQAEDAHAPARMRGHLRRGLDQHIAFMLEAMVGIREELGL